MYEKIEGYRFVGVCCHSNEPCVTKTTNFKDKGDILKYMNITISGA